MTQTPKPYPWARDSFGRGWPMMVKYRRGRWGLAWTPGSYHADHSQSITGRCDQDSESGSRMEDHKTNPSIHWAQALVDAWSGEEEAFPRNKKKAKRDRKREKNYEGCNLREWYKEFQDLVWKLQSPLGAHVALTHLSSQSIFNRTLLRKGTHGYMCKQYHKWQSSLNFVFLIAVI